ncbi:MAG TPA: hypothetical protein VM240_09545 [Verrucomicrobiae bacterium]|nr:hypothetical protein [Verrucomicrobiae bacterium]
MGETVVLPPSAVMPLQAPLAVQERTPLVVQLSAELSPRLIAAGVRVTSTARAGGVPGVTVSVADLLTVEFLPLQERVQVKLPADGATAIDPLSAIGPLQAPDVVQLKDGLEQNGSFAALQLKVEEAPSAMVDGDTEMFTVGLPQITEVPVTVRPATPVVEPPEPVQLSAYS